MKFWIILALLAAALAEELRKCIVKYIYRRKLRKFFKSVASELKLCRRSDSEFNGCLVQAITGAMMFFKDG